MKYSFEDKIKYNKGRKSEFSQGYLVGATMYKDYPRLREVDRAFIRKRFDEEKIRARKGDAFAKGVVCALRDASQERKAKTRK